MCEFQESGRELSSLSLAAAQGRTALVSFIESYALTYDCLRYLEEQHSLGLDLSWLRDLFDHRDDG
ncbi:hypothetical protein [Streptomyces termitum]|uniref:hypothetical protein n=1 Tax=Streptomyces termitum TaxID=67368 RepID=UPI0037911772